MMTLNIKTASSKLPQISTKDTLSFFRDALKMREMAIKEIKLILAKPTKEGDSGVIYQPHLDRISDIECRVKAALVQLGASHQLAWALVYKFFPGHQEMTICPSDKAQPSNQTKADQGGGNT